MSISCRLQRPNQRVGRPWGHKAAVNFNFLQTVLILAFNTSADHNPPRTILWKKLPQERIIIYIPLTNHPYFPLAVPIGVAVVGLDRPNHSAKSPDK